MYHNQRSLSQTGFHRKTKQRQKVLRQKQIETLKDNALKIVTPTSDWPDVDTADIGFEQFLANIPDPSTHSDMHHDISNAAWNAQKNAAHYT